MTRFVIPPRNPTYDGLFLFMSAAVNQAGMDDEIVAPTYEVQQVVLKLAECRGKTVTVVIADVEAEATIKVPEA